MSLTVSPGQFPTPIAPDMSESAARLRKTLQEDIRRSVHVFRVDSGGCNACELEIFASVCPIWDVERLGIRLAASPRHADILLVTGAMTRSMREPALRAYAAVPDPKIVMAYGACGCTGGIFHDYYGTWGGADKVFPVDVYIPGCPPTPAGTAYAFALALGILKQKLSAEHHVAAENERVPLKHPHISTELRVAIEREARRMAGYLQGKQIADAFFSLLGPDGREAAAYRMGQYLAERRDPRLTEVMHRLYAIYLGPSEQRDVRQAAITQQLSVINLNPTHQRDPRLPEIMQRLSSADPTGTGQATP
jgi:formate hydrogenlyase subunit 7